MGVGYQKFQAGSPDGYLDFGVISTPVITWVIATKAFFNVLLLQLTASYKL